MAMFGAGSNSGLSRNVFEDPLARRSRRVVAMFPNGQFVLDGTIVANDRWKPEENEQIVHLDDHWRPTGKTTNYTAAPAAASPVNALLNLFQRR